MAVIINRSLNGGSQVVHKFENGFGASVVKHDFSYGSSEELWELAVLEFPYEDDGHRYHLTYDTPITNDVIGHLDDEAVQELLARIEALEAK